MKTRWRQVTRGVPQEMILDPGPLSIFINGWGGGAVWTLSKFAEYTKLWLLHLVIVLLFKETLKGTRNGPTSWRKGSAKSCTWGRRNPMHQDMLEANPLKAALQERLLWLLVDKLNVSQKCTLVTKKTNSLVSCMRKHIAHRSREVIPPLFSALVRHVWVLCPSVGSPIEERHKHMGEIQQRATKMIERLENLAYKEKLRELGLLRMQKKRLWGILTMRRNTWWIM